MKFTRQAKLEKNRAALVIGTVFILISKSLLAQDTPRVIIPSTASRPITPPQRSSLSAPQIRSLYPWKLNIVSTVFWIGEEAGGNNPVPNHKSSWDQNWQGNYGGVDHPEPSDRVISFQMGDFRPKAFVPKLNPFYIALPYNDKQGSGYRPEASSMIPWFGRSNRSDGDSTLKGRWVQIYVNNRSCYAQWEDVGPFEVDDWRYVFGSNLQPRTTSNGGAGIDISPAVRDYLDITSGRKVHWRFVEASQVPYGPWKKYGQQQTVGSNATVPQKMDLEAQRRYFEYLKKVRDQQYRRKSQME